MSKFKVGDTVFVTNWGEAVITDYFPSLLSWTSDVYHVRLRDGVTKVCYETELSFFCDMLPAPKPIDCECGAKHTPNPTLHSSWCPRFI